MEVLRYCLYGSATTIIVGLLIYLFILKNRINKYCKQIGELETEIENKKVELITQAKDSEIKIASLESKIEYLNQLYSSSSNTQESIDKIEKSEDVKTDINDIINKYNEKAN